MIFFVVTGALLALLSLALLTRPLWWGSRRDAQAPAEPAALAALRQQLEQLAGLKASGVLGDAQYKEARQALERRIADAVKKGPPVTPVAQPARSKPLALGLSAFVCVVAAAGYAVIGTPRALDPEASAAAAAPSGNGHAVTAEQIDAMIEKLAARMKERPDDADGWAMLGRSYAALGRFEQATPALKQAAALRSEDPVLLTDYADALAVVNGRSLDGEPARLIEKALKLDPNNLKALSLAGTHAFNRKDYALALQHWEKMAKLAPDNQMVQQIQGGIDEARRLAGGAAPAPAPTTAAAPPQAAAPTAANAAFPGSSISGTVTLAPALAAKAQPDDTVFVFARAAEGSRMPLAIVRKQVRDLPFDFTLDDSMAMSPSARLSTTPRVVVGARVSARGSATPQPGDLQGLSAPLAPGASGLKVQIAEVVAGP